MNKHDTVIGYIEYLDCNGCVRERIPYVDAEKFKPEFTLLCIAANPSFRFCFRRI